MRLMPSDWGDVLLPHAPIVELLVRGTVLYIFLLAALRVFGRRQLSRLGLSDILVVFLLATAVRNGLTGRYTGVADAAITAAVLILWDWLFNELAFRSRWARRLVRGTPVMVVRDGELLHENARHERLTEDDVLEKLREHGVSRLDQVQQASVEPDGKFSVIRK